MCLSSSVLLSLVNDGWLLTQYYLEDKLFFCELSSSILMSLVNDGWLLTQYCLENKLFFCEL
jgi:hypothetical protein